MSRGTTDTAAKSSAATGRITVGLIPRVQDELNGLANDETGLNKADVINRAVSLLAFITQQLKDGNELQLKNGRTGETERIHLL